MLDGLFAYDVNPLFKLELKPSTYGKRYSKSIFAPPL